MQETWVQSLGWEDPLEEGMTTHSRIRAWRIPMDRGARGAAARGVTKSQTTNSDTQHLRNLRAIGRVLLTFTGGPQHTTAVIYYTKCRAKWASIEPVHLKEYGLFYFITDD